MPKSNKLAFVMYEESNPIKEMLDFLTINHFSAVISPLHDSDEWTKQDCKQWRKSQMDLHGVFIADDATTWQRPTGELTTNSYGAPVPVTVECPVPQPGDKKKAHRHVYFELDYSMLLKSALEKVAPINITYLEQIMSRKAYLRYLCHLDTPEKQKYDRKDVIALGGVDIACIFEKDGREREALELFILDVITRDRVADLTRLQRLLLDKYENQEAYSEVKAHYGYWMQYMRTAFQTVKVQTNGCDYRTYTKQPGRKPLAHDEGKMES